jgi:hypothetical protein
MFYDVISHIAFTTIWINHDDQPFQKSHMFLSLLSLHSFLSHHQPHPSHETQKTPLSHTNAPNVNDSTTAKKAATTGTLVNSAVMLDAMGNDVHCMRV